jgi:hypothetical protein
MLTTPSPRPSFHLVCLGHDHHGHGHLDHDLHRIHLERLLVLLRLP